MVARIFSVFSIAVIFNIFLISQGKKPRTIIEFTNLECVNQWPELVQLKCHINRTSTNISAIYAEARFSEKITNMNGIYAIGFEHNKNFINYTSVDLDYCSALQMVHGHSLIQVVAVAVRSVSNFPLNCPLKKNYTYFINGFTLDPKIVPPYMPEIAFRSNATFFYNKRAAFYATCYGRVTKQK